MTSNAMKTYTCKKCGVQFCSVGTWIKGKRVWRGREPGYCSLKCKAIVTTTKCRRNNPAKYQSKEYLDKQRAYVRKYSKTPKGRALKAAQVDDRNRWKGLALACMSDEDKAKTIAVYAERGRLNDEAGSIAFHVDHIFPRDLGGEHIWWNMQIITTQENLKKSNNFRPQDQQLYVDRINQLFNQGGL